MNKILLGLLFSLIFTLSFWIQPIASAKQVKKGGVLACFSGGREILRKTIVAGPFADEYKFAHEVKIADEKGEYQLNFSGGLCIIDRGSVVVKRKLDLRDRLSCYSGGIEIVSFEVYGKETTVDEYLEGRTFFAKASGNSFTSDSLHEYLVFGGGACLGEETR